MWRNAVKASMSPASDPAQEFVIGGYTIGGRHFYALIFGYWEGDRLMHAARRRSGFTSAVREQLHQRFRGLETRECPFTNLPESRALGRGPQGGEDEEIGLTARLVVSPMLLMSVIQSASASASYRTNASSYWPPG